ncbi:MAG: UDP-N-acetylmuramate--L-alanine ligase [Candidatus Dasytiphilus stammeri]
MTTLKLIPLDHHYIVPGKNIHFVGIGGCGMGSIASLLAKEGYQISGSDLVPNAMTQHLISLGAKIYFYHHPANIKNASVVVLSTAISDDNPEILAAYQARIPVIRRAEMLAELMRFRYGIAISGTHGKTTTTAMIVSIYHEAGLDPTFINGGLIKFTGTNARMGKSKYLIVEADESDASFLYLQPMVVIVTNIEAEHLDYYQGNFENLKKTFINFLHNLPFHGRAIICLDDKVIRQIIPYIKRQIITYGFNEKADIRIKNYEAHGIKAHFSIVRHSMPRLSVILNAPGRHNALNAAAAIALATQEGINDKIICDALENYQGTTRRFDFLGEFDLENVNGTTGKILLIDDYGHHPHEVEVTIQTVRASWPDKRIIMVFQPHRYTRTRDLYDYFVKVLSHVDVLLLLEVYPAGEQSIPGINSNTLCNTIIKQGKIHPILVYKTHDLPKMLASLLADNDVIIVQGAGNIGKIAHKLAKMKLNPEINND